MVSPLRATLSVFMTPWMKPTLIHCATSADCTSTTCSSTAIAGSSVPTCCGRWRSRVNASSRRIVSSRRSGRSEWATTSTVPTRRWEEATRARTPAAGVPPSRQIRSPVATTASARLVGMPSPAMASPRRSSRRAADRVARPSPPLEKGVRPDPFSAMSLRPTEVCASPRRTARPSPSTGEKPPNWCPA